MLYILTLLFGFRLQRILESVLLSYGGAWLAWFLTFMTGSVVSSFAGTLIYTQFGCFSLIKLTHTHSYPFIHTHSYSIIIC